MPGQAEITGKLTSAISQLQAAVREAEAHSQDSPMDGTEAPAAVETGQAGATEPPVDFGVPATFLGRAAGQAFAFSVPVPQFSVAPALCFDNHFGAAPSLLADTFAPVHSLAPLLAAAAVVPEQELHARIRVETKKARTSRKA